MRRPPRRTAQWWRSRSWAGSCRTRRILWSVAVDEGKIVTFYSYKGGTGRTMALANVAWILASNGLKVLVVDWDLESPGLHKYFHPFLDPAKVAATQGIIELITDYAWEATQGGDRWPDWVRKRAQIIPH